MVTSLFTSLFLTLSLLVEPGSGQCTGNVQADMVFMLDGSGSVGSYNFLTMLSFLQDLVNGFDIGSSKVRVGVLKYSDRSNTEFNLNTYYNKTSIVNAVAAISYTAGSTNTGEALEYLRTTMFTSRNGDRLGVANIGVLISDGVSDDTHNTATQAAYARSVGITLISIGIGSGIPLSELNEIATDPDADHVFVVTSFSAMSSIKSSFFAQACPTVSAGNSWAVKMYATPPGTPVHGGFGSWGAWSACSKTCGAGVRVRTRQCNNPVPQYGGDECSGDYFQTNICNNVICSSVNNYVQRVCSGREWFTCQDGSQCLHFLKKCDCTVDCADESDESVDYAGCASDLQKCTNGAAPVCSKRLQTAFLSLLLTCLLTCLLVRQP